MKKEKLLKRILLFTLTIICIFSITACNSNGISKSGDLVIKKNDFRFDIDEDVDIKYINPDEIFDINGTQKAEGRYANVTKDGKIRWDVKENVKYDETPIAKQMYERFTLNGKHIELPTTLSKLDKEFAEFERYNFKGIKKEDKPVSITNKKNGYTILSYSGFEDEHENLNILKNNKPFYGISYDRSKNRVKGVSHTSRILSINDIKVDGIGVGNTFNEVYEKYGKPRRIFLVGSDILVVYSIEGKDMYYNVSFIHEKKHYNIKTDKMEKTKPNIITGVSVIVDFMD